MAKLPKLPSIARRTIEIRLEQLREQLGFVDGTHLDWLDHERNEALWTRIQPDVHTGLLIDSFTGEPIGPMRSLAKAPRPEAELKAEIQAQQDALLAIKNDFDTVDLIGVDKTTRFLVGAYNTLADVYFEHWQKQRKRHEEYAALLDDIRSEAIALTRALWPAGRSFTISGMGRGLEKTQGRDWIDRRVLPKAAHELESAAATSRKRARKHEREQLEIQPARAKKKRRKRSKKQKPAAATGPESEPKPATGTRTEPPPAGAAEAKGGATELIREGQNARARRRQAFVTPLLKAKGDWSPFQWAIESKVDPHTVIDYLDGTTKKLYLKTRIPLANALGVKPEDLPR
jgi:hypothetical protein